MKYSLPVFTLLFVIGVLIGSYHTLGPEQRVQAQTGVIDLLPYKTYIPIARKAPPTPTPRPDPYDPSWIQRTPGATWAITELRMFTCAESTGSHVVVIESRDRYNQLVSGIPFIVVGNGGMILHGVTGEKSVGVTEVPLSRDAWRVYVDGESSDVGMDLRQDIDNDPDCPVRHGNHVSYLVRFQKVR